MNKIMRKITFLFSLSKQFLLYAFLLLALLPINVFAAGTASFGDIAQNLLGPTTILTKLAQVACYIIGTALILGSIAQYKMHRLNPKLVPLTTPIALLVLGTITVLIPYSSKMFGETYSATEHAKGDEKDSVLPLPEPSKNNPGLLPLPGQEQSNQQQSNPPSQSNDQNAGQGNSNYQDNQNDVLPPEGGGHWSNEPQYRR
ncbi:MAG: hypothetical protein ACHQJ6_03810 [Candidatus Berkiellales bacterium]